MIEIHKVQTTDGHRIDCTIPSDESTSIDAEKLMLFPALIDPHVHFRKAVLVSRRTTSRRVCRSDLRLRWKVKSAR